MSSAITLTHRLTQSNLQSYKLHSWLPCTGEPSFTFCIMFLRSLPCA